jgi:hypothetical protein
LSAEYYEDELNEDYITWFKRTQRGASSIIALSGVTPSGVPAEIPLGFRIRSAGITMAAMLDAITYIDPNDNVVSGYYEASGYDMIPSGEV